MASDAKAPMLRALVLTVLVGNARAFFDRISDLKEVDVTVEMYVGRVMSHSGVW